MNMRQPSHESTFERYIVSEIHPKEFLTLEVIKAQGIGGIYWTNSHEEFEVAAYTGGSSFVALHHEYRHGQVNRFRLCPIPHKEMSEELRGIRPIILIDRIDPNLLTNEEALMDYLLRKNYEVLTDKRDWLDMMIRRTRLDEDPGYIYEREYVDLNLQLLSRNFIINP